jgi:hypothetical protein
MSDVDKPVLVSSRSWIQGFGSKGWKHFSEGRPCCLNFCAFGPIAVSMKYPDIKEGISR